MNKLTTSLVVALGLVSVAGCRKKKEEGTVQKPTEGVTTPTPAKQPEPEKPLTGAELATKYQKCVAQINDGKFDDFRKDCMDDSYKVHEMGEDMAGPESVMGYFKSMKTAMPDWKLTPQIVLVSGRNILAVDLVTGTQSGELSMPNMPPIPATNKKIGLFMFHRLAITDANKASEEWAYMDPATMMGQLGLAPKDAPPTRAAVDKGIDGAPIVAVTADDAKEKANLEMFKKGTEAFAAHKTADLLAMMAPDSVEADQADAADKKGAKEQEAGMKMLFSAFSDIKPVSPQSWAAGDWVVETGKIEGTNDHDMGKVKKTGKKVSLDYAELAHFKDGKIDQLWRFRSNMQTAMQLGLMQGPGAPAGAGSGAGSAAAAPTPPTGDQKAAQQMGEPGGVKGPAPAAGSATK